VKLTSEQLEGLVDEDDPVPVVWGALWDIWAPAAEDLGTHYDRETTSISFEGTLRDIYLEFYQEVLPDRCVSEPSIDVPDGGTFLVMDSMSVREAPLFVRALESKGYDVSIGYSFATVPSETTPYRERVGYRELKKEHKTTDVKSHEDPSIDGDEGIVWSRYPDSLLETIQEGKTELSTVEEAYEKTESVLLSVVEQLDTDRIVIGSDHGYVRLESGYTFPIGESQKNRLQEVFSERFVSVGEANADDIVDEGLVAEEDGYYLPIGRYTWPARGKYSTYQHGGMSLVECLTPRIEVTL
jgi:hypothetical protein